MLQTTLSKPCLNLNSTIRDYPSFYPNCKLPNIHYIRRYI
nr:MAG TPA: hypothetical protein [Caudoviricetes sp.]